MWETIKNKFKAHINPRTLYVSDKTGDYVMVYMDKKFCRYKLKNDRLYLISGHHLHETPGWKHSVPTDLRYRIIEDSFINVEFVWIDCKKRVFVVCDIASRNYTHSLMYQQYDGGNVSN